MERSLEKKERRRQGRGNSYQTAHRSSFFLWSPNSKLTLVTFHTEGLLFVIDVLGRKWSGCGLQRWREGFEWMFLWFLLAKKSTWWSPAAQRHQRWHWGSSSRPVLRFPAFLHCHISTFTGYLEHLRTGSPLAHTGVTQESLHWNQWC